MPYLNVSWWNPQSPTVLEPAVARERDFDRDAGERRQGGDRGVLRERRLHRLARGTVRAAADRRGFKRWQTDVPADCLFFDQIGARPWRLDFNPAASTPLAYDDGWLSLMAPYSSRCLMVEDGWDRLGASFVGFAGGLQLMQREFN